MSEIREFMEKVSHPKVANEELSVDLFFYPEDDGDMAYCGDHNCCSGYATIEEAKKDIMDLLESFYDGSYYADAAADAHYAQQERYATGGCQ